LSVFTGNNCLSEVDVSKFVGLEAPLCMKKETGCDNKITAGFFWKVVRVISFL
jgi:hypothetical protein